MSDEQPFEQRRGPGRPPKQVTVAPREDIAAYDTESVINRRLSGEPFGARQVDVPMREPGRWRLYEANTLAKSNNHYEMVHVMGYVPVRMEDLAPGVSPESLGWSVGDGGGLCRGPKGDQKLYKMPMEDWKKILAAKTAANMKGIGSAKAVKDAVTSAASAQLGDEAATFARGNITVTGADRVVGGG